LGEAKGISYRGFESSKWTETGKAVERFGETPGEEGTDRVSTKCRDVRGETVYRAVRRNEESKSTAYEATRNVDLESYQAKVRLRIKDGRVETLLRHHSISLRQRKEPREEGHLMDA